MDSGYISKFTHKTFVDFLQTNEFLEHPLVMERASGVNVWDTQGKRYVDAIGGVFVASLGHSNPRLVEAARKQMETMTLSAPLCSISDTALRFVERLGRETPGDLNFIKTFSGGSESIEAAIKLVRQHYKQTGKPDKTKVISVYQSYHGATFGAMSAGGSPRKVKFEPQMPGFVKVFNPKQLRDDFNSWDEACRFCARLVEKTIVSEAADTVAAVLLEPVCNTAGIVTPTEEYFRIIREACDRHGVMLIFDEVLTGFGKTGDMFCAQTIGVTPDVICGGKGLSSGIVPMGAIMASERISECFIGAPSDGVAFAHGHTYAGNPLCAAVGMEVLDIIAEQNLLERSREMGRYLRGRLEELKKLGVVREVRGRGILLGVEFTPDAVPNKKYGTVGAALKRTSQENGLILRIDPDWFAIAPPLTMSDAEMEEMCDLIDKSVKDAISL